MSTRGLVLALVIPLGCAFGELPGSSSDSGPAKRPVPGQDSGQDSGLDVEPYDTEGWASSGCEGAGCWSGCEFELDGECDVPDLCPPGTDVDDCEGGGTTGIVPPDEPGGSTGSGEPATGSDTGGAGPACGVTPAAGACSECARGSCCDALLDCSASAPSACVAECMIDGGFVTECGDECGMSNALGDPAVSALLVCLIDGCAEEC